MSASRLAPSFALLALFAVLAAGCGSSGGGGGGGGSALPPSTAGGQPNGGGGLNGITIGNCLTDSEYIVSPSGTTINGSSPEGGSFILTLYKSNAAAQAAWKKKPAKSTALVESAVIEFKGPNSAITAPLPAPVSKKVVAAVKSCINQAKK